MYMYMICKVYIEKMFILRKCFYNYNRSILLLDGVVYSGLIKFFGWYFMKYFYCRFNLIVLVCGFIVNINRNFYFSLVNCAWVCVIL